MSSSVVALVVVLGTIVVVGLLTAAATLLARRPLSRRSHKRHRYDTWGSGPLPDGTRRKGTEDYR